MTEPEDRIVLDRTRVDAILKLLERMAAGDTTVLLPLSANRDELDAISHAINVLSDALHERPPGRSGASSHGGAPQGQEFRSKRVAESRPA